MSPFLFRFAVAFLGTLILAAVAAASIALTFWLTDKFGGYSLVIVAVALATWAGLMHAQTPEKSDSIGSNEADHHG